MDYALIELEGGLKDNAIPRTTRMLLAIDGGEKEILKRKHHASSKIFAESTAEQMTVLPLR